MKAYRIGLEPEGETYVRLITAALRFSSCAFFVIRDSTDLAASGEAVVEGLKPFMLSERRDSRWPGTVLLDEVATIYQFRLCASSLEILLQSANGLYQWQQPERPEDLGFLRADHRPWLISVAHESEAFIVAADDELGWLREAVPNLGPLIAEDLDDI